MEISVQPMAKKVRREIEKSIQTIVKKVMSNLPTEIIESNILTRLPIETLIRFTSVCQSWYSLFCNPYFINVQDQIYNNKIRNLLLIDYGNNNQIVVTDSSSPEQFSPEESFNDTINFPFKSNVVSCADGIVCVLSTSFNTADLTIEYHISLWSPSLRINKIIDSYVRNDSSRVCVGFGYQNQTNDYKVIRFTNYLYKLGNVVEIYSLASDSWRTIKIGANHLLSDDYIVQQFGVYASCIPSGAFCWLANKRGHNRYIRKNWIISFHMKDEAYKKIMLPYNTTMDHCGEDTLFIYKDSLAVLHMHNSDAPNPYSSRMCYIWVMKDYDDPKTWTKLCKFNTKRSYVSFVGIVETQLILVICADLYEMKPINKEVNVVDIDESQMKPTSYTKNITKARWVSSFTENLALLKGLSSFKKFR